MFESALLNLPPGVKGSEEFMFESALLNPPPELKVPTLIFQGEILKILRD